MPMRLLVLLLAPALALAGCASDAPPSEDPGPTVAPTPPMTPAPAPQDLFINGTLSGLTDCAFAGVAPPISATQAPVPAEAWGGAFELVVTGAGPLGEACVAWGDGPFSSTLQGTVPEDVARVRVAADATTGASFSIRITPA